MPYLFVKQKVEDFDKWYAVFKSHEEAQKEAGLKDLKLLRESKDANTIICFFYIENHESAKKFTEAPEASDALVASGIIGIPEVMLLDEV